MPQGLSISRGVTVQAVNHLADTSSGQCTTTLGRGSHLLVRDGEAYYTVWDGAIEEHIDVIQETKKPSLADVEDYVQTVQWISALGIISEISVQNKGFTVDEHLLITREETTYDDIV